MTVSEDQSLDFNTTSKSKPKTAKAQIKTSNTLRDEDLIKNFLLDVIPSQS